SIQGRANSAMGQSREPNRRTQACRRPDIAGNESLPIAGGDYGIAQSGLVRHLSVFGRGVAHRFVRAKHRPSLARAACRIGDNDRYAFNADTTTTNASMVAERHCRFGPSMGCIDME